MPKIDIQGLQKNDDILEPYEKELQFQIANDIALGISEKAVSIFMLPDLRPRNGEEIIITVSAMVVSKKRTPKVRRAMAERIATCSYKHFPDTQLVEVIINMCESESEPDEIVPKPKSYPFSPGWESQQ